MKNSRKKTTKKKIAAAAGITPDFFSHILWGRRPCPVSVAIQLDKVTGIDRDIWITRKPKELRDIVEEYIYTE
jgi:plasmid maintenance system antidote protein VapI